MSKTILSKSSIKILSELDVQALYLFGSRAMGTNHPLSDYDYGVLMNEPGHTKGDDLYMSLYDLLCSISPRTLKNDTIDIVFLKDVGLELQFHVMCHGVVIFEKNVHERTRFEEKAMLLYCDFRPLLDEFDRTILKRI